MVVLFIGLSCSELNIPLNISPSWKWCLGDLLPSPSQNFMVPITSPTVPKLLVMLPNMPPRKPCPTPSSAFSFSRGLPDGDTSRDRACPERGVSMATTSSYQARSSSSKSSCPGVSGATSSFRFPALSVLGGAQALGPEYSISVSSSFAG